MRPIDFNQQASAGPGFDIASYLQATGQVAKGKEEALSQFGSAAEKYFTEARDAESKSNALLGTVKNPELAKSIYGFDEDTAQKVVEYSKTLGSKERSMFLSSALQSAMQTNLEKEKFKNAVLIQGMQNASHLGGIGMQLDAELLKEKTRKEAEITKLKNQAEALSGFSKSLAMATGGDDDINKDLPLPSTEPTTDQGEEKPVFPLDVAEKEWKEGRKKHLKALDVVGQYSGFVDNSTVPILLEQAKAQNPLPKGDSPEEFFLQKHPNMKPRLDAALKTATGVNDVTGRLGSQIALIDKALAGEMNPADTARQLEAMMKEFNISLTPGAVSDAVAEGEGKRIGPMLDTAITSLDRLMKSGLQKYGGGIKGLEQYRAMLVEQHDKVAGLGNEVMNSLARDTRPDFAQRITGYTPRPKLGGSGYIPLNYGPKPQGRGQEQQSGPTKESGDPVSKYPSKQLGNWATLINPPR